jgi:hypothetical protein
VFKEAKMAALQSIRIALTISACLLAMTSCRLCPPDVCRENRTVDSSATADPQFEWDTSRPTPAWRAGMSASWFSADDRQRVIDESRAQGKPILCYLSSYVYSEETRALEKDLLLSEVWGDYIAEHFIVWEVNRWEDPILANHLSRAWPCGSALPIVAALGVSPDPASDELRVIRTWEPGWSSDVFFFPDRSDARFCQATPPPRTSHKYSPSDPDAIRALREIYFYDWYELEAEYSDWNSWRTQGAPIDMAAQEAWIREHRDPLISGLDNPMTIDIRTFPYLAWCLLGNERDRERAMAWWDKFAGYRERFSTESPLLPEAYFFACSAPCWSTNPALNIEALCLMKSIGIDSPPQPEELFAALQKMVILADGKAGGGFPARILSQEALTPEYLETIPSTWAPELAPGTESSPRDIVWVNARTLALWLETTAWYPETGALALPDGRTTDDFLADFAPIMTGELEIKAGDPVEMTLPDSTYMLGLYNELYQVTADATYLEKAGEIASRFDIETGDDWLILYAMDILPDLALALNDYGWLSGQEGPRETARWITERIIAETAGGSVYESMYYSVYAWEVVHSKCVQVTIVGNPQEATSQELLREALRGWDPGKVAWILDPVRDLDLINSLDLPIPSEPTAYVRVDDHSYPPARSVEELTQTMSEASSGSAGHQTGSN